jgi:hypothetical protein
MAPNAPPIATPKQKWMNSSAGRVSSRIASAKLGLPLGAGGGSGRVVGFVINGRAPTDGLTGARLGGDPT